MCALRIAAQDNEDNSKEKNLVAVLGFTSFFQNSKGANKMDKLVFCKFNIDTTCAELRYADGKILSIDCIAVENKFGYFPHARAELDWLIYNDPLSYTQMVLDGTLINYLKDIVSPHSLELNDYS